MGMNVNPLMAIAPANVLHIQLPKYHDNDDPVIHIRKLTKMCDYWKKIWMIKNYNIFQIFLKGELLTGLLSMR
jgi:hypothetical protein